MCHNHACTVSCAQNQGKSWTGSPSPSSSPPQSSPPWPPWPPSNTTATPDTAHDPPTALVHPQPRTTTPPLPRLHRPIHPPPSRPPTPTHHRPHPQLAHLRTPQLPRSHPTTKPLLMTEQPLQINLDDELHNFLFEVLLEHPHISEMCCWEAAGDIAKYLRNKGWTNQ